MPYQYGKFTYGKNKGKCWVRWGESGKKYAYTCGNKVSRERAKKKAYAQAKAIYASGYRE